MIARTADHLDTTTATVLRLEHADVHESDAHDVGSARQEDPVVPSMDNKEQLHQRVTARLWDLQVALDQLDAPLAQGERGRALAEALAMAKSSMSGGWDRVGEVEAAHLARWLRTTEDLRVTSPGIPIVAPPFEHESQRGSS